MTSKMRFGLITPVLTLSRIHNSWEEAASFADAVTIVQAADQLGFNHVTCAEHVGVPVADARQRGGRYWDSLATLSYFAARTERVRLATHVIVLGYHHPLALLKRYGTLDALSGGRLTLGVGVGSLQEEFDVLGAAFKDRGLRADDAMVALRDGFGEPIPSHDGPYYRYGGFVVEPCSIQKPVPMWVGGRTGRSLRRAVNFGDGWAPFRLTRDQVAALLASAQDSADWTKRSAPFDVVLVPEPPLDPITDPEGCRELVEAYRNLGATMLNLYIRSQSLQHCIDQMHAFVEVMAAEWQGDSLVI